MNDMACSKYLKYYPNHIAEVRKLCGYGDEQEMLEAIAKFKEWIMMQNHFIFKDFDDKYLESFIIHAKGSLEKAKQRLDKRCTYGTLMADLFTHINMDIDFGNFEKVVKHVLSPLATDEYYRIMIATYDNDHIDQLDLMDYIRVLIVTLEYGLCHDSYVGYECIVDMETVNKMSILGKINPITMQKIMSITIDCYGTKIKSIHFINSSKFVDAIVTLVKQGMSAKIGSRIRVHKSSATIKDYIDKKCLPSDFGGDLESVEEMHKKMYAEIRSKDHKEHMKASEMFRTDETKRTDTKFNEEYLGVPGSFRSLRVD